MSADAEFCHPRDATRLDLIDAPAAAFEAAMASGRLHHAWLLTGPKGVGKAAFAYRMARRLLGARSTPELGPLASAHDDPVGRLVAARAHPDLLVLEPGGDDGKSKSIGVDHARLAPGFFAKTPAIASCRVALIDSADDLRSSNDNAENALLKTLEEPSGRGVLLLVSHAPGRLLPTIRSRCRRLVFAPWPDEAVAALLRERIGLDAHDAEAIASVAHGSPGRALALHAAGVLEAEATVRALLASLPAADPKTLARLSDGFRGAEGPGRFDLLLGRLGEAARERAEASGGAAAERWSRAWSRLGSLRDQVDGLNLDRVDAFWAAWAEVRAAVDAVPC